MAHERSKEEIKEGILGKLKRHFGKTLEEATKDQIYKSCALSIRDVIVEQWTDANKQVLNQGLKRLYYLSAEFLMGRALVNNMVNLHLLKEYNDVLCDMGLKPDEIEEQERDAGLGNGGLGRLAACFLDSLSTLDLPVTGCSIRYEYGLFKQRILDGEQVEVNDNWLEAGNVWEIPRPEEQVEVRFGGEIEEIWTETGLKIRYKNSYSVLAIPYDYPVIGYMSKMPATLRLWSAKAKTGLDMNYFNRGDYAQAMQERELAEVISKVLYPEDNHEQGRQLRLKQFYFFTSATMQHIVRKHKQNYGDLHTLPNYFTVQINDTHPTLAIPELLRILMDEEGMGWDEAMDIVGRMFNYTNHTVLVEGLECWNEELFQSLLPRICQIIQVLNEKFCDRLWQAYPGQWDKIGSMAIVAYGEIRMANLCIAVCGKVNGVSRLHGEILKTRTFRDFYTVFPDKFLGITNGVTHRRWLAKANQPLTELIADHIGDGFLKDYREMDRIGDLLLKESFLDDFMCVKRKNKERLAAHLKKTQGIEIDPGTVFDVHAKRLHEYKRQLLKALHILHLYHLRKTNPQVQIEPATFLFAAKASPGYARAKNIIRLILAVAKLVNNDPDTKDILRVVFIENYSVSEAEVLIPAADISEQISTAGFEASGTGNMKFMMNGAVTIGTMDGANVEISEEVGLDNIFIFGASEQDIEKMERYGTYKPGEYYEQNTDLRYALNAMIDGTLPVASDRQFSDLYHSLLFGDMDRADRYYLLYDFAPYAQVYETMMSVYRNKDEWKRMAAMNTAKSGHFAADRTIHEYNDKIWHLKEM
ncbi:glycogen/starch/alpha-glucan phosphorylase [Christensenella timonensis]|uniref:glycogen/starch/alpha-glucan phosphorylase n=1 Tax=Christensenella timonensis TaxID=1816678 RepID=UPI00082EB977|nr:glycogen/starch/alpha-glucan phosphorylase [Christensenella timonensis]